LYITGLFIIYYLEFVRPCKYQNQVTGYQVTKFIECNLNLVLIKTINLLLQLKTSHKKKFANDTKILNIFLYILYKKKKKEILKVEVSSMVVFVRANDKFYCHS
jgi:hypothetical protein